MNSYHPNIRFIVKTNPTRFLKKVFGINPDGSQQQMYFKNWKNSQHSDALKYFTGIKRII